MVDEARSIYPSPAQPHPAGRAVTDSDIGSLSTLPALPVIPVQKIRDRRALHPLEISAFVIPNR